MKSVLKIALALTIMAVSCTKKKSGPPAHPKLDTIPSALFRVKNGAGQFSGYVLDSVIIKIDSTAHLVDAEYITDTTYWGRVPVDSTLKHFSYILIPSKQYIIPNTIPHTDLKK